jgi:hypothetical protein
MFKEEMKSFIHKVYGSLMHGDIEKILTTCTKDVTLTFASYILKTRAEIDESLAFNEIDATYEFKGQDEIKKIIIWLRVQFSNLKVSHRQIFFKENKIFHMFLVEVPIPNGKGFMPVHALYEFHAGKFSRIQIRFLTGYLSLKRKSLKIKR